MTATELYEIVKDHRDVWDELLYVDPTVYGWFDVLADSYISDSAAEVALLGLGVKWLVENSKHNSVAVARELGDWQSITYTEEQCATAFGPSPVAAVYAAIAEVKRAQASTENR